MANGSLVGTTTYVDTGVQDFALRLNGSSFVDLGTNPAVAIVDPTRAFSVSFWIRPRAIKEIVPIRLATAEGEFALYLSSGNNGDFATHFGFRGFVSPATNDRRTYVREFLG